MVKLLEEIKLQLLERLAAIEAAEKDAEYPPLAFDVDTYPSDLPIVEIGEWGWGFCTSETCSHNSHDPRLSGPRVVVQARAIGGGEYVIPDGRVFVATFQDCGTHFCPRRRLKWKA